MLYGQRVNVDMHNIECLAAHPGDFVTYESIGFPVTAACICIIYLSLVKNILQVLWPNFTAFLGFESNNSKNSSKITL